MSQVVKVRWQTTVVEVHEADIPAEELVELTAHDERGWYIPEGEVSGDDSPLADREDADNWISGDVEQNRVILHAIPQ